ncbi:hypothetical protein IV733_003373 [Salmonella enterica]|uniref:hypothetical protein n=1 Tax=Salmonella enterica TaxID=28901 RepID=UPI00138A802D|nr:hypothetical protein [Salmonella enterica]EDU0996278.1 hypothetical protein [Salmonella enterica subsp. enterica serovar Baildon]EDV1293260.1 hypothetical protein [Salmonella enterica subsp. salamae]EEA5734164.1 hypothetical protein [Salmonella enterica subsp. enterica serovar Newport]EEN4420136.1 hypothetical protein [Salmonella enterica subsp. enterica serovar Enteritidis]HCM1849454.1 hypothetical protein [Salmonella enterica subsp. salamae serovar 42:z29:-]
MKRIKEIRIVLSFLLLASFSTLALAYFCAMNPEVTLQECAKICAGAGVMGIPGYL